MERPIPLFKTPDGQATYLAAYDAALGLWPVPYRSRLVTTTYGQTHVISSGPEDASPLVLLHGGQASSTMWFANVADLSARFHVLALDTPGEAGKSVPSRQNATRADLAAWVEGVLDALGISKTHMMGLSRGGWLTVNFALHVPERLERIVLLSPAACFIPLNAFFQAVVGIARQIPTRFVARSALYSWVTPGFSVDPLYAEQFVAGLQTWNWSVN